MTKFLRSLGSSPPLLALVFLLLGRTAQAQVDTYTLTPSTGTFTALSALSTTVPALLADDAVSGAITLPFTFNYDGTPYTTVYLNSNGLLSFNSGLGTTFDNAASGLSNGPANNRPFIAPFFDDLDGRTTGAVARYQTTGAAGSRVFTAQWLNWNRYSNSGGAAAFSFQIKLYEGTNVVQFVYRNEAGAIVGTPSASIGLAGFGSGAGSFLSLNNASAAPTTSSTTETNTISTYPATGQIYTFTPAPIVGCPAPRTITLSDVTGTGATLSFRGNLNATTYTIVVTPQGGTALPTITTSASPVVLTGLSPNTTYNVTLVSNCASGTSTTATVSFATTGPYCSTNIGGTCGGNDVTSVSITGTTLNATGLTCTTSGGSSYTNYPATGSTTATLNGGVPYQLNVNTTGNSIISAWLDSNHDNTFQPGEWVQVAVSSTANQVSTVTLFVPANANPGLTGLRIRSRAAGNPNAAPDACTEFFSGETKDFTVTIGPPAACPTVSDAALSAITTTSASLTFTPLTGATGGYSITVTPQNGTALPTITATTSPVTLTGLTPNTNYTVTIVSNCGTAGNSVGASVSLLTLPAPPANNECTTAVAVPVTATCTTPTTGTVLAATQSIAPTTCGTATTANDVWYSFVASGVNQTLSVTGQFAGVVDVRSGACAATSSIYCNTFTSGSTGVSTILSGLTTGQTYLVRIYPNGTTVPANNASGLTICVTPGPTPPANDECANATPLPISTACTTPTSGTVAASSQSQAPTASCGFGITQANDVWYSFVANGTSQQLTFAPQFNGVVDVRSGTCANSASVYCNTAAGGSQLIGSVTGLTSGQTYYLRVYASTAANPAGTGATFTLCLTAGTAAPPNDDCAGAIDVPVGLTCTTPTVSTNVGATNSTGVPTPTCQPNGYTGGDTWFKVTVPANGTVTVSTVQPTGTTSPVTDTQMSVYSGACGALQELGCNDEGPVAGYSQLTLNGRTPGEVLFVRVWTYGLARGPIAVCATSPNAGPCDIPTNIQVSNIGATTATLSFTPSSSASNYTISILRQGSTTPIVISPAPTASPVQLTGLTASSAYTVSITSNCSGGINSATAKTTFATITPCPAPTNPNVSNITATTSRLTFATVSGAVSYTVTLTPTTGAPITQTITGSPVDLTGLTPGVTYAVSLATNCGGGRTSTAATTTLTTLASYCDSGLGGVCGTADITAVSITGTTLDANGLTCATANSQAYTLYPATGNTTTELVRGTTYPLNVTTAAPSIVSVWIDYNHNLTYEASEFMQVSLNTTAGTPATVNITVPNTAPLYYGPTSMRVRSRAVNELNGPTDACSNFTSGETKDFVVNLQQFPPCPAPTALALSAITTTSASLSFTPATGAASYTVTLTPGTGPALTFPATGSPVSLTGLNPSTTYSVSVVTTCTTTRNSPAATASLTTLTPCPTPTSLSFSNISTTTASLNFTASTGAGNYTVTLTPGTGPAISVPATGSPVNITGLTASTTYTVTLVADCGNGNTSAAATANLTTATPCPTPTGVTFTNVGTTTATLTFSASTGASNYTLVLTPSGTGTPITVPVTGVSANLTGLTAGTTYTATLVADCGNGNTSPAATGTLTTATPCATPSALVFSAITQTTASLAFTASTGANGYTLVLTPTIGPAITVPATGSPVSVTGLTAGTTYTVTLVADCGNGNTSPAATATLTTPLGSRAQMEAAALVVYPNPSNTGQLTLRLGQGIGKGQATLLNALGQSMLSYSLTGAAEQTLNVRQLATGVYTLLVRTADGQTLTRKVVLE